MGGQTLTVKSLPPRNVLYTQSPQTRRDASLNLLFLRFPSSISRNRKDLGINEKVLLCGFYYTVQLPKRDINRLYQCVDMVEMEYLEDGLEILRLGERLPKDAAPEDMLGEN